MKLLMKTVLWFVLILSGAACDADDIDWKHWELEAFEAARAQDKVILVSVGMEGRETRDRPRLIRIG